MKKTYQKPRLTKREKLSAVAAAICTISHPCP